MANVLDIRKTSQQVKLTLADGKERTLYFDLNAFAELEKRFGTLDNAMKALQDGMIKNVKIILWAGLIHDEVSSFDEDGEPEGYNITPYSVGKLIPSTMMPTVSQKLGEAMGFSMPENLDDLPDEVKQQLKAAGVPLPESEMAIVVLTPEEQKAADEEAKNA